MSEAEKAAEVLGSGDAGVDAGASDVEGVDLDESTTEPEGLKRLFRTDKPLDLNEKVPWWNPEEGGIDRIGAALKQMGGWEFIPPAVWIGLGTLEEFYNLLTNYVFAEQGEEQQEHQEQHGPQEPPK